MAEQPVNLKTRLRSPRTRSIRSEKECIIHFQQNTTDLVCRDLTDKNISKIHEITELRRLSDKESFRLDTICNNIPVTIDRKQHGIHRWCYQSFTNVKTKGSKRHLHQACEPEGEQMSLKKRKVDTKLKSPLFPNDKCIFCDKYRLWVSKSVNKKGHSEYLTKCVTKTAESSIKEAIVNNQDAVLQGKLCDVDLIAKEAHYHNTCRRNYTREPRCDRSYVRSEEDIAQQEAHVKAFENVCQFVTEKVIQSGCVLRINMLHERYLSFMQKHSPKYYNASYSTQKLKDKLSKHFGSKLNFWNQHKRSDIIFSNELETGQAVETAFEFTSSDDRLVEEAASLIRREILQYHNESQELRWPPTAQQLLDKKANMPPLLVNLLSNIIRGHSPDKITSKPKRLVESIAQDICSASTNGRWKMPKHLLLGMTLRHLTGSAELVTMMNRFGHCQSYSQILEMETAMCNDIVQQESVLPTSINPEGNIVTHLCWDNFDLCEETPSGYGTTHSAHGIVIQEREDSELLPIPEVIVPCTEKSKLRSVVYQPSTCEPCFLKQKIDPSLKTSTVPDQDPSSDIGALVSDFFWIFSRTMASAEGACTQNVPSWAGWVSLTTRNSPESNKSTVEYMPPINAPVTDNSTVLSILKTSQEVSRAVGQPYTIVTFDLAVAKKAFDIVWQHSAMFTDVIVCLGAFHTLSSYLGALGKKMEGSGFAEVVIESGICASGSLGKVMDGKHYNRSLRVHKLVFEALERLLLEVFDDVFKDDPIIDEDGQKALNALSKNPTTEAFLKLQSNESCLEFYKQYDLFKDQVRSGELGKTAQFWLNYMDKVGLILRFLRATKTNDFDLHIQSLRNMCPLYFAYDHINYARYGAMYLVTLLNLDHTHPGAENLLRSNGMSVSRSKVPSSRNAVDITIEQTINRHAKSSGGIIGFSRNYSAYYRWCMTRHVRASYVSATFECTDMISDECCMHKDTRASLIQTSESNVRKVVESFCNFINPFSVERESELFCISSGAPVPKEVERDLLMSDKTGEDAFCSFVQNRLVDKSLSLFAPLKKNKLKTFACLQASKTISSPGKKSLELRAERNLFGQLILLAEEHSISLELVLTYPLGPVPWSLATADGCLAKTDKSKLLHYLESAIPLCDKPQEAACIIDGNALLQALTTLPSAFEDLAMVVFKMLPKFQRVDFVTDTYPDDSIKNAERARRGSGKTFLISGPKTKVPRNWKEFMSDSSNKVQLIELLLREWSTDKYAPLLFTRKVYFVCLETCVCLTSIDGTSVQTHDVPELFSSQEEADTRIILHMLHCASTVPEGTKLIIRSPDTDVLVLLVLFCQQVHHKVLFDTGTGNKRRLLNVQAIIEKHTAEVCSALLGYHAFSGCDSISAFVRKGKILPLKCLLKNRQFLTTFEALGVDSCVSEGTLKAIEEFTCAMYGRSSRKDINRARYDMFKEKFRPRSADSLSISTGTDLSLLPPCQDSLYMHIRRANYQAYIWKCAHQPYPDLISPEGSGWQMLEGKLSIDWFEGEMIPNDLTELVTSQNETTHDNNDDDDDDDDCVDGQVEYDNFIDVIFSDDDDSDS